jgi:putative ABC transport system permease protein
VLTTHLVAAVCVAAIAVPGAVVAAWIFLRFGMTLESGVFSHTAAPAMTWRVMTVACFVTVLASIGSCLPGAITVARGTGSLNDVSQTATRHRRWEGLAMIAQVGLVFAAGAQAVLVALVLFSLSQTNVGLRKTNFVVVSIGARAGANVEPRTQLARYKRLLERLERRGIHAASANIFPLTHSDFGSTFEPRRSREQLRTSIRTRVVTPSYFQITGLVPTSGRLLTDADAGSTSVIVTDAFGPAILQRRDVMGMRTGNRSEWTIVDVVPAVRQYSVTEEVKPEAYVLYDDFIATSPSMAASELRRAYILAEAALGASTTVNAVRQEVGDLLPDVEIQSAAHVRDLIDLSLGVNRLVAAGSVVFAAVALLLAALGLYAMVSHGLERRRREFGIRIALGASAGRIAAESVVPIGVIYGLGVGAGMALVFAARSAIQSVMAPPPGVSYPPLLVVSATAAIILLAVVIGACYKPVRTSTETDPALSLRVE